MDFMYTRAFGGKEADFRAIIPLDEREMHIMCKEDFYEKKTVGSADCAGNHSGNALRSSFLPGRSACFLQQDRDRDAGIHGRGLGQHQQLLVRR